MYEKKAIKLYFQLYISITNIIQMKENKKEINKDVVWPIRMKRSLKDQFKKHCDDSGYSMNKRMKVLIENDIEHGK